MHRWKVTVEIQDGCRKDAEEIEMLKNICDKFSFSLFHNAVEILNECENVIKKVIKNVIRIAIT